MTTPLPKKELDLGLRAKCHECGSELEVVGTGHSWCRGKDVIVLEVEPCRECLAEALTAADRRSR
jgi:hypothetical protein